MPNVEGGDWRKEIGDPKNASELYTKRLGFYEKRVKLKTKVGLDSILTELSKNEYKSLQDHQGHGLDRKIAEGDTLFKLLRDYYKTQFDLKGEMAEKEAYVSLAYLMRSGENPAGKVNVDDLLVGGEVTISNEGKLSVKVPDGTLSLLGFLRPEQTAQVAAPAEPVVAPMPEPSPPPRSVPPKKAPAEPATEPEEKASKEPEEETQPAPEPAPPPAEKTADTGAGVDTDTGAEPAPPEPTPSFIPTTKELAISNSLLEIITDISAKDRVQWNDALDLGFNVQRKEGTSIITLEDPIGEHFTADISKLDEKNAMKNWIAYRIAVFGAARVLVQDFFEYETDVKKGEKAIQGGNKDKTLEFRRANWPVDTDINWEYEKFPLTEDGVINILNLIYENGRSSYLDKQKREEMSTEKRVAKQQERLGFTSFEEGSWEFKIGRPMSVDVNAGYGGTLYHFIRGILLQNKILTEDMLHEDAQAIVDAFIHAAREYNPDADLDNFDSINGKTIKLPSYLRMSPLFKEPIEKYSRLQQIAMDDGFSIESAKKRGEIYENAKNTGTPVGDGEGFYRAAGYEDSEALMAADARENFEKVGRKFADQTDGWQISYSHVLRDEQVQKKQKNGVAASTHFTGRSIDITDGRFRTPDGKEITWSANPELREKIEQVFRPLIIKLVLDNHGTVFPEAKAGHYHIYFPKVRYIELSTEAFKAKPAVEKVEYTGDTEQFLDERIRQIIKTRESVGEIDVAVNMREFERMWTASGLGAKYENREVSILQEFNKATEQDMLKYNALSFDELQSRLDELTHASRINQNEKNTLGIVRKQRIYDWFVETTAAMTPEEVKEYRPFRFLVFDDALESNSEFQKDTNSRIKLKKNGNKMGIKVPYHFADIEDTWKKKEKHKQKTDGTDKKYYQETIAALRGKSNSIDAEEWYSTQSRACEYFRKHGEELGFSKELVKYMTPSVVMSVMHAEFFSGMPGGTYLKILPTAIETENLVYGPAVHDAQYSAGVIQMIRPTFENVVGYRAGRLKELQSQDDSYTLIIPSKNSPKEMSEAMLTDINSQLFWGIFGVAYHIELGFNALMADPKFKKAWNSATEEEKYEFIGAFSPMAINIGRGSQNSGTYKIGKVLAKDIKSNDLSDYTDYVPTAARIVAPGAHGARGAELGRDSIKALFNQ